MSKLNSKKQGRLQRCRCPFLLHKNAKEKQEWDVREEGMSCQEGLIRFGNPFCFAPCCIQLIYKKYTREYEVKK